MKRDGSIRFCVDYPKVNAGLQFAAYLMPWIDELLEQLGTAQFFMTLDLTKALLADFLISRVQGKNALVWCPGLLHPNTTNATFCED